MPKLSRVAGTTSLIVELSILNSSVTTGAGLTGLAYNTSGLKAYYKRNTGNASVAITLQSGSLGTWSSGGFKEVDSTNMPGIYELGIPDAALAAGADSVLIYVFGATNVYPVAYLIELTGTNNQDGVRGGMTALPNAAAAANGGLPTVDSTNSVKVQAPVKKNTALNAFAFQMQGPTGLPLAGLGTSITAQRSIDGAAFAPCTNTPSELNYGMYAINLSASDLNGGVIVLRFSATGARDTDFVLVTGA